MKRRLFLIALSAFAVASCGGTPADQALQKIHDAYRAQIEEKAKYMQPPLVAETTTTIKLTTSPDEALFPGSTDIAIDALVSRDVRQEKNPLVDILVSVNAKLSAPSGTFGAPSTAKNAPAEHAELQAEIGVRTIDRTALLSIKGFALTAPTFLPAPFSLPAEMMTRWYGASFDEINKNVAESSKERGVKSDKIEDLIARTFSGKSQMSKEAALDLFDDLHLWKGIEILPGKEDQNLVQIRVESDKGKIQKSVRAFVQMIAKTSGDSWSEQVESNQELQQTLKELQSDNAEFLKDMGLIRGVLTADATTNLPVGFNGEILDSQGVVTATVEFSKQGEDGFSGTLTDVASSAEISIVKEGKKVSVSFTDPESEETDAVTLLTFTITELSSEKLVISDLHYQGKDGGLTIDSQTLSVTLANEGKDMTSTLRMKGTRADKPVFSFSLDSVRKEVLSVTVEKPTFVPFENFQADITQALMGSAQ